MDAPALRPLPPVEQETDDALFQRAQRGDTAAFAAFYARHADGIVGYFRLRLWRRAWEDADDLAADLWARVWARRAQYRPRPDSQPKDWLYTIAINLWYDWCRRRTNREPPDPLERWAERKRGGHGQPPTPAALTVEAPDVDAALAAEAVRAAVANLPPGQRVAVELRWFRGYPRAAAARALGTTENGIQQRHIRALRNLRTDLAAYAPDAP